MLQSVSVCFKARENELRYMLCSTVEPKIDLKIMGMAFAESTRGH